VPGRNCLDRLVVTVEQEMMNFYPVCRVRIRVRVRVRVYISSFDLYNTIVEIKLVKAGQYLQYLQSEETKFLCAIEHFKHEQHTCNFKTCFSFFLF
jgi:hypothetical protein